MSWCRCCANTPFAALFGIFPDTASVESSYNPRVKRKGAPAPSSSPPSSGTRSSTSASAPASPAPTSTHSPPPPPVASSKAASATEVVSSRTSSEAWSEGAQEEDEEDEEEDEEEEGEPETVTVDEEWSNDDDEEEDNEQQQKQQQEEDAETTSSHEQNATEEDSEAEPPHKFTRRTQEAVKAVTKEWLNYLQPRASKIWSQEQILSILETVAQSIDASEDPFSCDESVDVIWNGVVSKNNLPVILVEKPNEDQPTRTYVSRAFVFLFADDESLKDIKEKGESSFEMSCGNTLCVNVKHMSSYTSNWKVS